MSRAVSCVVLAVLVSGCAASRAARRAETYARLGDWDQAVTYYTRAVQADPGRTDYKIALERAMVNASRVHLDLAKEYEASGQLGAAVLEYRKAGEYDPGNQQAALRAIELEKQIRDQLEAARPKPVVEEMRERARRQTEPPLLNPASREPIDVRFTNASTQDILNFIGSATGINIIFDRDFRPQPFSIQLEGVTLEEALQQIMAANQLWYKVLNDRTIMVIPDTAQKRAQLEEQVVRTFYVSHADPQEVAQLLTQVLRFPGAVPPFVSASKTSNTVTVRGSAAVVNIMERLVQSLDRPRAEIIVDVEILEVNRTRTKRYGLDLSQYAVGVIFSPEQRPDATAEGATPFNLNTISQGVSTADFYLTVPQAVVRFLETDAETKLIAKPQLRGAEGTELTLNLGDEIPVPSTVFTPVAAGGATVNPLTSFQYRPVGVNVQMTPRVTYEGDIILEITVESSTLGSPISVAGQSLPTFGTRRVNTQLRLREGESHLLAGLLREDDRRSLRGVPGILRLPILSKLLSDNDVNVAQTDIVMLLTPRVVRTHELTQQDLDPIYIGTQQNIGIGGAPALIAPQPEVPPPPPAGPAPAVGEPRLPTGTSPVPGMTTEPLPGPQPPPAPVPGAPETPPEAPPAPVAAEPAATQGTVLYVTPPGELQLGGGPYTAPVSIGNASRVSVVSLALSYNPAVVRVAAVQEGSFMRQGGMSVTFTQSVDAAMGRVDIGVIRAGDVTGASGSGLLAALLLEPVAEGSTEITLSGVATTAEGEPVTLQFAPVTIVVR